MASSCRPKEKEREREQQPKNTSKCYLRDFQAFKMKILKAMESGIFLETCSHISRN
jgi:hypothetical protein